MSSDLVDERTEEEEAGAARTTGGTQTVGFFQENNLHAQNVGLFQD